MDSKVAEANEVLSGTSTDRRFRHIAARIARVVVAILVGYYVLAVVLLVVYRFSDPPITGVQLQRRLEARIAGQE
ncbi:MAG TPA: hypothetical protein VMM17_11850 [Gemmatimonadaceae bacterium]|nr:hypothetical protein [Gemmatimonadaceae bacterium]